MWATEIMEAGEPHRTTTSISLGAEFKLPNSDSLVFGTSDSEKPFSFGSVSRSLLLT